MPITTTKLSKINQYQAQKELSRLSSRQRKTFAGSLLRAPINQKFFANHQSSFPSRWESVTLSIPFLAVNPAFTSPGRFFLFS
jgi:hypothetical protein